jgi:signal transduction histidine kinase
VEQPSTLLERRDHPLLADRALAPGGRTRVWRLLCDAADRAAPTLARREDQPVDVLRMRLHFVAERVDQLIAQSDDFLNNSSAALPASDVRALRSEFLTLLETGSDAIDGRTIARGIRAFDCLLEPVDALSESTGQVVSDDTVEGLIEIAHDMQSPLTSVLFLADTLRRSQSGPVNAVQERQLGLIYGAAFALSTLVSDVIDTVRGHRLLAGEPLPFSIAEAMLHVCAIVRPIAEEKGLELRTEFPARDGRIGYAPAIGRVLLNLTTNALKFTERGSVTIGCTELSETEVRFWVSDTGVGIPESMRAGLLDSLHPALAGNRFSSTGLGLAICSTLLDAIGSSLELETELNTGTRFSFRIDLPRAS